MAEKSNPRWEIQKTEKPDQKLVELQKKAREFKAFATIVIEDSIKTIEDFNNEESTESLAPADQTCFDLVQRVLSELVALRDELSNNSNAIDILGLANQIEYLEDALSPFIDHFLDRIIDESLDHNTIENRVSEYESRVFYLFRDNFNIQFPVNMFDIQGSPLIDLRNQLKALQNIPI